MKYLCLAYGDAKEELLKQDEVLRQHGGLVAAVDSSATTVRASDGVPTRTDGGFAESTVPLAGFSIIEAPDLERAIELVADTPFARAKGAVEVRPIDQISDQGLHAAGAATREPAVNTETPPVVTEEHRRLQPFIGTWSVTGQNGDAAPNAPNAHIVGEDSYVWLPGGFFLLGHWDHRFDNGRHIGMTVLRYDTTTHEYSAHNIDNLGYAHTYRVSPRDDGAWSFEGDWERATMRFGNDGRSLTIDWEVTKDRAAWSPLCHLDATKS